MSFGIRRHESGYAIFDGGAVVPGTYVQGTWKEVSEDMKHTLDSYHRWVLATADMEGEYEPFATEARLRGITSDAEMDQIQLDLMLRQ